MSHSGHSSYLSELLGKSQPKTDLEKTLTEVSNLNTRLNTVGMSPEVSSPGPFISLLRLLARPGSATLNVAREFTNANAGPTPGRFDPGAAFIRGLTGKQETWGKDIVQDLGVSSNPLFRTSIMGMKIAPNAAGMLGTAIDLLNPLDPLNWLLPGAGKVGMRAIPKGMPLLERAFGSQVATELAEKLGPEWVENSLGRLYKTGEGSAETVGQLVGQVGHRAGKLGIAKGVNPESVAETMLKAIEERGFNASTRLADKSKYALNMGIQVPFTNKTLGRVNLPGSQYIATPIARGMEKVAKTPLGQAVGRNFSTRFVPNTVPGSVWTRMLRSAADKPTIDTRGIIPDPNLLETKSGQEAYQEIMEGLQGLTGKAASREQDYERALDEALKGMTDADRKELMKGLVDPTYQVKPHQVKALEFLQRAREKMVEDYRRLGVNFTPLEDYVPFITVGKPLTKDESELLKGAFGARIKRVQGMDLGVALSKQVDPHLIPRTLNAIDPAEVNKVLGREWLTEDAGVAMARRGIKAIRGQEATTFLQGMMEKYGLSVDDLESLRTLPDGYVVVNPRVEGSGRVALDPVKEGVTSAFALPQEFVRSYNEYTSLVFNPNSTNDLMRFFDKSTRLYKTVAYMWTPGHIPRDFMSNMYNLWLGGMRNPDAVLDSVKLHMDVARMGKVSKAGTGEWSELLKPEKINMEEPFASTARLLAGETEIPKDLLQAEEIIKTHGKASITLLENQMHIGVPEARRIIDELEKRGVLGAMDASGKRKILGMPEKPLENPIATPRSQESFNGVPLKYPQWEGTTVELYESLKDMGLTESSGILNEFQQVGKDWSVTTGPFRPYTEAMRKATRLNDNVARVAGVIDNLKKGMSLEEAVGATKKVLFDYNDLTPFEKKFMKRVVPFYTWMRKNIPLQVEMLLKQPGKYSTTYKAMHDIGTPEDTEVPSFISQQGGLKIEGKDGKARYIIPNLPFADLSKLPINPEQTRELLGSVNPALRVIPEMSLNRAFFSGQPLENYGGELQKIPLGHLLTKLGVKEEDIPLINKRYLGYMLNQIPPLRNLDIMSNPQNTRQVSKAISWVGGPQIYPADWAKLAATYEQRDKLRDLIRVLGDKGIDVPTMKELESTTKKRAHKAHKAH